MFAVGRNANFELFKKNIPVFFISKGGVLPILFVASEFVFPTLRCGTL